MIEIHGWAGQTILVTGAAGYIGSRLIRDLAEDERFEGATIRMVDNLQRGSHAALLDLPASVDYEFMEADLLDPVAMRRALRGVRAVVHLAALVRTPFSFDHPTWTEHVNHWGTAHLVEHCLEAEVRRFIFASSASVYGPGGEFDEDSPCHPVGPYSQSKLLAEQAVTRAAERGLDPTVLRLATVYGFAPAVRFDAVPNRLAYLAAMGRSLTIHGSGEQVRAVVHVRDAAGAIRFCLANEPATAGATFNAGGQNLTIAEMADAVRAVRPDVPLRRTDQHVLTRFDLSISSDRLTRAGWEPGDSIEDGMQEVLTRLGRLGTSEQATPMFAE